MKLFVSSESVPDGSKAESLHVYNGLDCCITLEVFKTIHPQLDEITAKTYAHSLSIQAPIFEMECRGIKVDMAKRFEVAALFESRLQQIELGLEEILSEGIGFSCNPNSPAQLKTLFYDIMGITPIKEKGSVTVNRKALEKIRNNFYAEPIVSHILAIRDLKKKLSVLKTGIDADGRIRTSYNIAGTDTGRLSSYASAFGSGTNLQNITGELRSIFVADPGYKLAYIDLEQAESRAVGAICWNLFHDGTYLDFCESGDLHTAVARMTFPHLPWTGDLVKDKIIGKQKFYRDFDYRDACKREGHATNYGGKPPHISREIRIPLALVQEFQHAYFKAFPSIQKWHSWVRAKLLKDGWITTFLGRRRWFFGRRWEDETIRSAIAYEPQSCVADYLNRGMLTVWKANNCEILLQVHDAIVIQYPEELERTVVPAVRSMLEIEVPLLFGRTLTIPTEAFVGWNWGYAKNSKGEVINPDGLLPFTGLDSRVRTEEIPFMDRLIC